LFDWLGASENRGVAEQYNVNLNDNFAAYGQKNWNVFERDKNIRTV